MPLLLCRMWLPIAPSLHLFVSVQNTNSASESRYAYEHCHYVYEEERVVVSDSMSGPSQLVTSRIYPQGYDGLPRCSSTGRYTMKLIWNGISRQVG